MPAAAIVLAFVFAFAAGAHASVQSAGGVKYVTKALKVSGFKSRALTATCPKHTHVLGGGETNKGPHDSILLRQTFPVDGPDTDHKTDDGWRVRLVNKGSQPVTVKAEAVCGKTKVRYAAVRFVAKAGKEVGQETATCPAGTFAYSGGFAAPAKSKVYMNSTFPSDPSSTGATAWGTYVDNPGSNDEDNAAVIAVCGGSQPEISTGSSTSASPSQVSSKSPCPAGKLAYGGGFDTTAGYKAAGINSNGPLSFEGVAGRLWNVVTDLFGANSYTITHYTVCGPTLN
jgi:hypothetical protein